MGFLMLPPGPMTAYAPLAEAEAAARSAMDHAMAAGADQAELEQLRAEWIRANDALADAIIQSRQSSGPSSR